jgi:hypothetical protein
MHLLRQKTGETVERQDAIPTGVLAEAVRFELTNPFRLPVFKTGAIDHSATLPVCCPSNLIFGGAYHTTLQTVTPCLKTCGTLAVYVKTYINVSKEE